VTGRQGRRGIQLDDPGNSKQKCQLALCGELAMALS